jgi:hypothetical protein
LSVLLSFGHCVVCSSVFWPLCCLFFCLLAIVLSVRFRYTDSDCPFGIFKLFWMTGHMPDMTWKCNNSDFVWLQINLWGPRGDDRMVIKSPKQRVHGRSQELLDRISWNLVEL